MAVTWEATLTDYAKSLHGKTDCIYTVHWECTEEDGDIKARRYGAVGLGAPSGSYTPYSDVTQAQALTWAKAALGNDEVAEIESSVSSQLADLKNPPTASGKPWS